jgi:predicted TIM-barrel fold metal-dependent hydrolase
VEAAVSLVDFHIHVARIGDYQPWVIDWTMSNIGRESAEAYIGQYLSPDGLQRLLDDNGLDYGVCLAEMSPICTGVTTNEYVAEMCRGNPRLIPFGSINPFMVARPADEVRRCAVELGIRGLKLYPTYQYFYPNDAMMYPVYAVAQELGLPIMFHTGSSVFRGSRLKYGDPLLLDDVAVDFPGLKILLVHGGRGFWYERAAFLARLHENVYLEISGLPPAKLLTYFPELERLSNKVVFGSDWPGMPFIARNVEAIRALDLSEGAKARILGGNAAAILGLVGASGPA